MSQKHYTWHKMAESIEELHFPASGLKEVEFAGKKVCLILFKDHLYACAASCPHAGGVLAEGYVDVIGNIVCPVHQYKFNIQNGRNNSGEGYFLKNFPIQKREDGFYLGIDDTMLNR
jgi:nitrite reductase/ring-hydroxylating ferredoxin subunit